MTSIRKIKRARTCDVAFTFRMGAGFPGEINRTHPFSAVPGLQYATSPVLRPGDAALYYTDGTVRRVAAGDTGVTKLAGVAVRSYPTQGHSSSSFGAPATIGAASLPSTGIIDVLEDGFIMVKCNGGTPVKGGVVYVWVAADSGAHVQGQFEAATSAGNTATIANAYFTGGADANGNVEIQVFRA